MPGMTPSSKDVTAGATATKLAFGFYTTEIMFRALSTNTDNIIVQLNNYEMLGGNVIIRPGESVTISITQILQLKAQMGYRLTQQDFLTGITYTGAASNPEMYVDALSIGNI